LGQPLDDLRGGSPEINLDQLAGRVIEYQDWEVTAGIRDGLGFPRYGRQFAGGDAPPALEGGTENRAGRRLFIIVHALILPGYKQMSIVSG
jgi:hypothetical protein